MKCLEKNNNRDLLSLNFERDNKLTEKSTKLKLMLNIMNFHKFNT